MCGILGQVSLTKKIDQKKFDELRDLLTHRGPDGWGTQLLNQGNVALGHRRLSIIDLSANGLQPMSNEDGSVWLTFNGEIYNYQPLRNELTGLGHKFHSKADSEVLVHGYEEWGIEELLKRVKGMFAFAIFDERSKTLSLARDRFGIKPLYYYRDADNCLFASETKSILKSEAYSKELDLESIQDYLYYKYVPAPKTAWKGIFKLEPGSYALFDVSKKLEPKVHKYWELNYAERDINENQIEDEVNALFENAIREHFQSDVDVGLLLSGGMDSTIIAQRAVRNSLKVKSFCIGFKDYELSEHKDAALVADYFHLKHHEEIIEGESLDILDDLNYYFDDLYSYSTKIPYYFASKASQHLKVALAGDGGDEVFSGYKWHYDIHEYSNSKKSKLRYLTATNNRAILDKYADWHADQYDTSGLLNQEIFPKEDKNRNWLFEKSYRKELSIVKRIQWLDLHTFLQAALWRADSCSMANSLEIRVPFLDHELVEYMFSIPEEKYFRQGKKKFLLSKMLGSDIPGQIKNKPKKGFSSPLHLHLDTKKIRTSLKSNSGILVESGIIDPRKVEFIDALNFDQLFGLWNLESWLKIWHNGNT